MTLVELDATLRGSLANARAFTRAIFTPAGRWTAVRVEEFLNDVGTASVATVSPTGWPHAALVPVRCVDGEIYVAGSVGSVLERNVLADARVAFTVFRSPSGVFGQGTAASVSLSDELRHAFGSLVDAAPSEWRPAIFRIAPARIFAS